jgi:hypothetical protein
MVFQQPDPADETQGRKIREMDKGNSSSRCSEI